MTIIWDGAANLPQLPFRRLFKRLDRPVPEGAGIVTAYTDGAVTLRTNRAKERYHEAADLSSYQGVQAGDFVVHGLDIMRGSVGVADSTGAMSPVCVVCQPAASVDPRYVAYVIRLMAISGYPTALARGIRDGGADFRRWETLARLPIPVPPLDEQRRIADFLDHETARIDALIGKQLALVDGLRRRREHLLTGQVGDPATRPTLPLKRALAGIDQGVSPDTSTGSDEATWWVLKTGATNHGVFREEESKPVPDSFTVPPRAEVHLGDLITSRASGSPDLVGSTALVDVLTRRLILSDKNFRLRPNARVATRYLFWVMNSPGVREQITQAISGADGLANNLPLSSLRRIRIWLPNLTTQLNVVATLDRAARGMDSLVLRAEQFVEVARERRAALITAAVTGQIDVAEQMATTGL